MTKTILITGATDGLGLETAKALTKAGHRVLVHGRSAEKLAAAQQETGALGAYLADLSKLDAVVQLAEAVAADHTVDVLINNAGVFKTGSPLTEDGLDVRFMVNTVAPYVLARRLAPGMPKDGRIVNLSSAAQAPVDPAAFAGARRLQDMEAYAQSKLAITIWTQEMAAAWPEGPLVVSVNPGSLLATKMVREGFGVAGSDPQIGAGIMMRAALSVEFEGRSGQYFDNDAKRFAPPHPAAADATQTAQMMEVLERLASPALEGV